MARLLPQSAPFIARLEVWNADRADGGASRIEQLVQVRAQQACPADDGEGDEDQDKSVFHRIGSALVLGKTSDEITHLFSWVYGKRRATSMARQRRCLLQVGNADLADRRASRVEE